MDLDGIQNENKLPAYSLHYTDFSVSQEWKDT